MQALVITSRFELVTYISHRQFYRYLIAHLKKFILKLYVKLNYEKEISINDLHEMNGYDHPGEKNPKKKKK